MKRTIALLALALMLGLAGRAATDARQYVMIGDTLTRAVKILGMPTSVEKLDEGRGILFYGTAQVTVQSGKVVKWKGFPPPPARANPQAISPDALRGDVLAALGWPCAAHQAIQPGDRSVLEIWEYRQSSLTFRNGRLAGWVNAGDAGISLGSKTPGAAPLTLGASRQQAIAAIGTPDTLESLSATGDECWHIGVDSLTLRAGKVAAWENIDRALPLRMAAGAAGAKTVSLGDTADEVGAALGTPLAIEPREHGASVWYFEHTVLDMDSGGQVSEIATKRLQDMMTGLKPQDWPNFLAWVIAQPHLDYHADTPLTRDALSTRFLAANKEDTLFAKYRTENGKALYDGLARAGNSVDFLHGVKAALNAGSSAAAQSTRGQGTQAYAAGTEAVATAFQQYLNDTFAQFLATNYVQAPDLVGGKSSDALAALTALKLDHEIVFYRNPDIAAGTVTDSYPGAVNYLPTHGVVTLYVVQ